MRYGISEKVWQTIVKRENAPLAVIMLAAAVDVPGFEHVPIPDPPSSFQETAEIAIGYNSYAEIDKIEMPSGDYRGTEQQELEMLLFFTVHPISRIRNALASWIDSGLNPTDQIKKIAEWDKNLGAWLTNRCAKLVLQYTTEPEVYAQIVDAVDRYVLGEESADNVFEILENTLSSVDYQMNQADYAVENAANIVVASKNLAGRYAKSSLESTFAALWLIGRDPQEEQRKLEYMTSEVLYDPIEEITEMMVTGAWNYPLDEEA